MAQRIDNNEVQEDATNQWLETIMQQNEASNQLHMPWPKIQPVPPKLREIKSNRKCYEPLVVSIGPYHHGRAELRKVERLKFPMARDFVLSSGVRIEVLYKKVAEVASEARSCYEEGSTEKFNDNDFTQMMFLDGCFILHFIFCYLRRPQGFKMKANVMEDAKRDLFLLENQLPFLVLQLLMNLGFQNGEEVGMKAIDDFMNLIRGPIPEFQGQQPQSGNEYPQRIHLLQLFHTRFFCKPDPLAMRHPQDGLIYRFMSYRSPKELKTIGIHCMPGKSSLFKDVTFRSTFLAGTLTIPPIVIDDSTKSMLLNLVAYETCPDTPDDLVASSYICLLDSLIGTPEDVKELRSKGIIVNALGSDQKAADLVNEIATELVSNPEVFQSVMHQIQSLHQNNFFITKSRIAVWLQVHFSGPWAFLVFTATIFGLALTAIQTYVALVDNKKPSG